MAPAQLYSTESGQQFANLTGHGSWIMSLDWNWSGELLLSGGYDVGAYQTGQGTLTNPPTYNDIIGGGSGSQASPTTRASAEGSADTRPESTPEAAPPEAISPVVDSMALPQSLHSWSGTETSSKPFPFLNILGVLALLRDPTPIFMTTTAE